MSASPPSPARNERGQTIILVVVMVMSFLMFFVFAVNTGLLINAKISVQAAADAAAYAGAATQARQLNSISYLNYDMRRQYKKFLFRNTVVGSLGLPRFPKNIDGSLNPPYDFPKIDMSLPIPPAPGLPLKALRVPVICIPVVSRVNDDQCVKLNSRNMNTALNSAMGSALNAISGPLAALKDQVKALSDIQQKTCQGQSYLNLMALKGWLFKGIDSNAYVDTELLDLISSASAANSGGSNLADPNLKGTLQGLMTGLGLYPRNILHLMRIETLESFLNEAPVTVGQQDVESMERNVRSAEGHERTILAFKSALSNLNTTLFSPEQVTVEELNPGKMIQLEPVLTDVDTFIQMMLPPSASVPGDKTICNAAVYNFSLSKIPVGVRLVPIGGRNVVYGVRVRAFLRPRGLLFLPTGESLELTAVAGAKPFGSRIGPKNLSDKDFIQGGQPTDLAGVQVSNQEICKPDSATEHKCRVPNLDLVGGGPLNFFHPEFLQELRDIIGTPASTTKILEAQYHAMAPNPTEVGHYNILPPPYSSGKPPGSPPEGDVAREFIPVYDGREKPTGTDFVPPAYRFYAPIYRGDSSVDFATYIDRFMKDTLPNTLPNQYGLSGQAVRDSTQTALQTYVSDYLEKDSGGELKETTTFAAIEIPIAGIKAPATRPWWLTRAEEVLSSWGPETRIGGYKPRFGYSVRFVALRDLVGQGVTNLDSEFDSVPH